MHLCGKRVTKVHHCQLFESGSCNRLGYKSSGPISIGCSPGGELSANEDQVDGLKRLLSEVRFSVFTLTIFS